MAASHHVDLGQLIEMVDLLCAGAHHFAVVLGGHLLERQFAVHVAVRQNQRRIILVQWLTGYVAD